MPATVFASAGGRKYHFDQQCKAFVYGQQLNDWDAPEDAYLASWAYPKQHPLKRMSSTKAAIEGKLPCLFCVPAHLRAMPDTADFDHKRVDDFFGTAICARCRTWQRRYWLDEWGIDHRSAPYPESVAWPCTSAIILGLVPRPCSYCQGTRTDPEDPGDWIPEVGMHHPGTRAPCPACHGSGLQDVGRDVA